MQFILFIKNKSDASIKIKKKDVKTTDSGIYATTDNILILNVVSMAFGKSFLAGLTVNILYSIYYGSKSNTTTVTCYYCSLYVDHPSLNNYINNKNDNTKVFVYPNSIDYSIDIRLYYI